MKTNETAGSQSLSVPRPAPREKWELTPAAFCLLLTALHAEPEQAGAEYVRLHERLSKYFECRGCATPQELADETINRVARKLAAGETIRAAQPIQYFYGVARNVLRESFAQPEQKFQSLDELPVSAHPREDPHEKQQQITQRQEKEHLLELLVGMVQQLPAPSRALLLAYSWGEKRARIERHRALAVQLGITANALKIRVFRIRAGLEKRLLAQLPRANETNALFSHLWARGKNESCHTQPISENLSFCTCLAHCRRPSNTAMKRSISPMMRSSPNCSPSNRN